MLCLFLLFGRVRALVEVVVDGTRRLLRQHVLQLVKLRRLDGAHGLEALSQCVPAHGADTGDPVEPRDERAARVLLVVIGDGEAVHLLLNPPDEGEEGRAVLDADLLPLRRHQRAGAVAVVLDHAEDRHLQPQRGERRLRGTGMALAAVDQQEVGQLAELLVPVEIAPEAPRQHLLHGAVVVGVVERLDLEAPVVALEGPPVAEHDHRGDHVGRARVGDIVGLHPPWGHIQIQHPPQQLQQFVEDNHYEVVFTISGGILNCADVWEKSYSNIMKISEFALNEAKRNGKNRYNIFTSKDYENFLRKKQITKILRQSILNHFEGFEAYFQPLFHAEDNTLYGAETLMRFHCAELGMISPAEFIPILEETGLIIPAGRWIMRQALACGKKIQRVIPNFQISINVSYIQIMKSDIISEIAAAIEEFEVNPANVVIELTESGLLESDPRFTSLWGSLKSEGIRLALDDFGTGYSNFHYLYELKPDIIKIDRSFTAKALSNEYDYNLLSLMSDMVHHLDLKLCVEGIETEEERIRLQQVGPDYSQGFFFGRPCPYKQFHDDFVAKCSA